MQTNPRTFAPVVRHRASSCFTLPPIVASTRSHAHVLRLPHSCRVQWGGTLVPASELPITQLCNPSCCLCDSFAFLPVNAVSIPPAPSVVFARVGGSFAVASSIMPRPRTRRMHGGNGLWHSIDCGGGGGCCCCGGDVGSCGGVFVCFCL